MTSCDTLCAAYASDDNYAKFLGVSMLSLLQTNADFKAVRVFILDCGIGDENRRRLKSIADSFGAGLAFLPSRNVKERLRLNDHTLGMPVAAYARLFLTSVLPRELERVLYLDCDALVCGSLRGLWESVLDDRLIAGVQDTVDKFFQKIIGLEPNIPYINSGVLLINLKLWREENLEGRFFDFIQKFGGKVPHHDQGTINGVCGKRRTLVPLRYNLMSNAYSFSAATIQKIYFLDRYYTQAERDEAIRRPAIIHFTAGLFGRPWEEGCTHPAKDAYLKVLRQSPWKDDPLLPDGRKKKVRVFAFVYRHIPLGLFETAYRALCWVQHLNK